VGGGDLELHLLASGHGGKGRLGGASRWHRGMRSRLDEAREGILQKHNLSVLWGCPDECAPASGSWRQLGAIELVLTQARQTRPDPASPRRASTIYISSSTLSRKYCQPPSSRYPPAKWREYPL
jgi:hypothetical protein